MSITGPPDHTIQLAGGQVHVHLNCTRCSGSTWTHQQIAWLAESIAQQLSAPAVVRSALPTVLPAPLPPASSPSVGGRSDASDRLTASLDSPTVSSASANAPTPAPTISLGKKGPRTRTGCFTCRMKRVKCDEAKPICTRCKRNPGRHCVYPKTAAQAQPRSVSGHKDGLLGAMGGSQQQMSLPLSKHLVPPRPNRGLTLPGAEPALNTAQEQFALFLDGVSFLSAPVLLNARPTKQGVRARSDRVLAKLWEAQMFISASGGDARPEGPPGQLPIISQQATMATALVSAAKSLGAFKRAFKGTRPAPMHEEMIARSRQYASDAASVIHAFNRGDGFNDPEAILILLELFLLRDCASADPQWAETHTLLRTYIQANGGPKKMLEDDRAALLGNSLLEHHLVYLTIYDTFAALTLNLEPYLLSRDESQWIEDVTCAQQVSHADFGLSLQILFCVAKVATLLALKPNDPMSPQSPSAAQYPHACKVMYDELETVTLANIYSTPSPMRVQFGDLLIRHALICHLHLVAFGSARDDPIVRRSTSAIMELLAEVAIRTGSMINLIYPMLMAAGLVGKEDQERLQVIMDFAKMSSGLVEIEVVEAIAHECWRRRATGQEEMKASVIWNASAPLLIL